jgi:predicted esterase YcpF (UPF0227 family)
MMPKIIYIHGFMSSGESEKAKQLREYFPNATIISPDFSPSPKEVIQQLHNIIAINIQPTIAVGTSLGGFYALYLACVYDIPAFIINPSLEPHISLQGKVGLHKRYNTGNDYNFTAECLNEMKHVFDSLHKAERETSNLNFYLSGDDEVLDFEKLNFYFPNRRLLKRFDNAGHRFSKFSEVLPDIQLALDNFRKG